MDNETIQKAREYTFILSLLDAYSRYLEDRGYMDSDWYTEENVILSFLREKANLVREISVVRQKGVAQ